MKKSVKRSGSVKGPSRFAKGLTAFLALQSLLKGAKVNAPHWVPEHRKAIAVWPLGTSVPSYSSKTYEYAKQHGVPALALEWRPEHRKRISRKMFPGSAAPTSWYEPKSVWRERLSRKVTTGRGAPIPVPVITGTDVKFLEGKGFVFPKSVHNQAQLGKPITANKKIPNWLGQPQYHNAALRALVKAQPPVNRFSTKKQLALPAGVQRKQLALPAGVQRKLLALENRARAVAVSGTAKALTFPWKVAAKARSVANLPARGYKAARQTMRKVSRSVNVARRRAARAGV